MPPIQTLPIRQFCLDSEQTWQSHTAKDNVVCEEPLEIWLKILSRSPAQAAMLDSKPLLTLMRTPGDDINLVLGWLFSSGVVTHHGQIVSLHHSGKNRLKTGLSNQIVVTLNGASELDLAALHHSEVANSACGVCGQQSIEDLLLQLEKQKRLVQKSAMVLDVKAIIPLVLELDKQQKLFQQTGGNHGVGLFNQALQLIDVREDVGRHNAFDKVIGANSAELFTPVESDDKLSSPIIGAILSGRVGFEMIQKAAMANLRYVFALGAPSNLAIELAKELDIGLVGFIKAERLNLYSGEQLFVF